MKDYDWQYNEPNPFAVKEFTEHGVPEILAGIMVNRGLFYNDYAKIKTDFWTMNDEYKDNVKNVREVAQKFMAALMDEDTKIHVFADYDADGVTSAAIVFDFTRVVCRKLGVDHKEKVDIFVPNRKDGYGLNESWAKEVVKATKAGGNKAMVITFDNGITKLGEIKLLQEAGIEVIVTDHHEPDAKLPDCLILDPKATEDRNGEELCGAGIAWLVVNAMCDIISDTPQFNGSEEAFVKSLKDCICLASIGTIGDMMSMSKFNLALVNKGLEIINSGEYRPVSILQERCKLVEITAPDIGWGLAPVINGCGRMGDTECIYKLFTLEDKDEIQAQAKKAYDLYNDNKEVTKKLKTKIVAEVDSGKFDNDMFCVYTVKDVPEGIVGKVANQLAELTGKPSVVLLDRGKEVMYGSGRCPSAGLSILDLLKPLVDEGLVASANGHKSACGVGFYADKLDEAKARLNSTLEDMVKNNVIVEVPAVLKIDKKLSLKEINVNTFKEVYNMPYSMDFYNPLFEIQGDIVGVNASGNNPRNVKYTISDGKVQNSIWAWNIKPTAYKPEHTRMKMVGTLERNFLNPKYITLHVIDIAFE